MLTSVRRTLRDREMMRAIFTLAWPTVLEQALSTLVQYADTAQVGVLGAQASAAIGLTTTVMWLLYGPMGAAGMSVLSCISMSLGARDEERARKAASQGVILALAVGGVLMVLTLAISPFLPRWLGGSEEILRDASVYFAIVCAPMVFRSMGIVFGASLRAAGDTKTPMLINLTMNAVNIVLNFLFISGPRTVTVGSASLPIWGAGWGVAGAAIASAVSYVLGGVLMARAAWREPKLGLRGQKIRLCPEIMSQCLRVGTPIAGERLIASLGHVAFSSIIARLGTIPMAAHTIALTAEEAFYIPGYGMQAAAATLAGYSAGERSEQKLMQYTSTILFLTTALMVTLGALLFLFPQAVMSIFTPDAQVIALGSRVLRIVAISEPFFGILVILEGVFNSVGDTKAPLLFSLISIWGVRVASTFVCVNVFHLGLEAVWYCMVADNMVRFALMTARYVRGGWKRRLDLAPQEK